MTAIAILIGALTMVNLGLTLLMVKLYTEYFKVKKLTEKC